LAYQARRTSGFSDLKNTPPIPRNRPIGSYHMRIQGALERVYLSGAGNPGYRNSFIAQSDPRIDLHPLPAIRFATRRTRVSLLPLTPASARALLQTQQWR